MPLYPTQGVQTYTAKHQALITTPQTPQRMVKSNAKLENICQRYNYVNQCLKHLVTICFFFTSNMSWLNIPFGEGERRNKRRRWVRWRGKEAEERGRNELSRSPWGNKEHIHSNFNLRKDKYHRNYSLLSLSINPCIVLRLWPSKSFVLCMYFQPDGRRDDRSLWMSKRSRSTWKN